MFKEIMQKRWFCPALIGLFLFIWLLSSQSKESASSEPAWGDVRQGDFIIDAIETGEVRAVNSVDLSAPMEWRMDMQIINMVPEGTIVKAGDFLVQFDTSELQSRLEVAQDALSSSLAQRDRLRAEQSARISQLQADIASAGYSQDVAVLQRELLKYEAAVKLLDATLEEKKAQIQLTEAQTNLESQQVIDASALSTLKVEIEKGRGNVRELEQKISNLTLSAPIGGLVVYNETGWGENRKKIAIGDKPRPGEAVVSIPNLEEMQVTLRVNEMDAARLASDQSASIVLDAYPNKPFTGKVAQIAKLAQKEDWDSEIKDFEVIVLIDQADSVLKPGMTAKVQVVLGMEKNATSVPTGAIFEHKGEKVVFPKRNYPKPLRVETGARNDQRIVVKGDRLAAGDLVSCTPPDTSFHRLGYTDYFAAAANRPKKLARAFAEMEKRGLIYDYDGNRNRRIIAEAPSGAAGDIENVRGEFPGMSRAGRPAETDAASMKRLQQSVRGMQPGPGAAPGMRQSRAPGDTSAAGQRRMMRFERVPGDTTRHRMMPAPADSSAVRRQSR